MQNYKPTGIIHLTGEHDTGKTLAALGLCHPKKVAFFHDDVKLPPIEASEFGYWCNMTEKPLKVLELYHFVNDKIKAIPNGIDCVIFDTWTRFGASIRYYAKANPYQFREKDTFAPNGTIRNMEQWGESHKVEASIIAQLANRFKTVVLITHLKDENIGGVKTGKQVADAGKSINRVCNLRLWLRHNNNGSVPVGLVLKRISKPIITDDGIEFVNILPRKIQPLNEEKSIWQSIDRYYQNPIGNSEPGQHEMPTEFELSILDGILTDDQREVWRANIDASKIQDTEENNLIAERVKELSELPNPIIINNIKDEFGRTLTNTEIEAMK